MYKIAILTLLNLISRELRKNFFFIEYNYSIKKENRIIIRITMIVDDDEPLPDYPNGNVIMAPVNVSIYKDHITISPISWYEADYIMHEIPTEWSFKQYEMVGSEWKPTNYLDYVPGFALNEFNKDNNPRVSELLTQLKNAVYNK